MGDYTGAHTVVFRVFFSFYYYPEGRAKLRWAGRGEGGGALYFLGWRIAYKGAMDGARNIIYFKASFWSSGKIYASGSLGPEENHFVSGNFAGFSLYISPKGSAKLRWA